MYNAPSNERLLVNAPESPNSFCFGFVHTIEVPHSDKIYNEALDLTKVKYPTRRLNCCFKVVRHKNRHKNLRQEFCVFSLK